MAIRYSLTCLQRRAAKARSHRLRKRLRPTPGGSTRLSLQMARLSPTRVLEPSTRLPTETPVRALHLARAQSVAEAALRAYSENRIEMSDGHIVGHNSFDKALAINSMQY